MRRAGEPHDRAPDDQEAREHENRSLGQRGEMLRLAVPVLMPRVRGPHGDADGEEREQRRDQVGAGVHRLGHEAEAARREAGAELQPDEGEGGEDGEERGATLGGH